MKGTKTLLTKTLLIDNYDSFTYNLFHLLWEVNGVAPWVIKNDQLSWSEIKRREGEYQNIVISPGPGQADRTHDFGVSREVLLNASLPVLGICLGHQGLGQLFGASLIPAPEPVHGRISPIYHTGEGLFKDIPNPFHAVRYHSWILSTQLSPELIEIASTPYGIDAKDRLVMAIRHQTRPLWGLQFHPESICSEFGFQILTHFRELSEGIEWQTDQKNQKDQKEKIPRISLKKNTSLCLRSRRVRQTFDDAEEIFQSLFSESVDCFWLDSSAGLEHPQSRWSVMGDSQGPYSHRIDTRDGCLDSLEKLDWTIEGEIVMTPSPFPGGYVGFQGYEGEGKWIFPSRWLVFDAQEKSLTLMALDQPGDRLHSESWFDSVTESLSQLAEHPLPLEKNRDLPAELEVPLKAKLHHSREAYLKKIKTCLDQIKQGESYEICLTNQIEVTTEAEPFEVYRVLRQINPAPFAAYLKFENQWILSASPELFLKISPEGLMESKPIKGTLPRGKTEEEDQQLKRQLREDEKTRSENLMIVDLLRNDLGKVAEKGSVCVPSLMHVESFTTVHQLVSTIQAKLDKNHTARDAVDALFPGGSMTGAPKKRTLEILKRLEERPRGAYSGVLGYFGCNGSVMLSILIRTLVAQPPHYSIGIGGAITSLSDPEQEFEETLLKAKASLNALAIATNLENEEDVINFFTIP